MVAQVLAIFSGKHGIDIAATFHWAKYACQRTRINLSYRRHFEWFYDGKGPSNQSDANEPQFICLASCNCSVMSALMSQACANRRQCAGTMASTNGTGKVSLQLPLIGRSCVQQRRRHHHCPLWHPFAFNLGRQNKSVILTIKWKRVSISMANWWRLASERACKLVQ